MRSTLVCKILQTFYIHIQTVLIKAAPPPKRAHQFSSEENLLGQLPRILEFALRSDVCSIYFDLRKAFDSVAHFLLMQKLTNINLDPYTVQWIGSYHRVGPL